MRSVFRTIALAIMAWLAAAPAARAEVLLSLRSGRITLIAKDATVRQILQEWERVGKTKIVNGERIPGGPVTLELKDVPEAEALDVLLRNLSGYIAAPRETLASTGESVYESISVMPTIASAAPRTSASANVPAPFSPPTFTPNEEDQENGAVRPGGVPPQPARPPIFSTFPTPQTGNPNPNARPMLPVVRPGMIVQPPQQNQGPGQQPVAPPGPIATPSPGQSTAPLGVSTPGMIAPVPATQPGQPGQVPPQRPPGE